MTGENDKSHREIRLTQQANVARARARRFAMQAVYQYLLTDDDYNKIAKQVSEREIGKEYDRLFFNEIIRGVIEFHDKLDDQLLPFLSRPITQLDYVEYAVLLVAVYEFKISNTPPKVIINEAIIIAKKFASKDSHKFINGVLDKLYKKLKK